MRRPSAASRALCLLIAIAAPPVWGALDGSESHVPSDYALTVHVLPDSRRIEVAGTVRLASARRGRRELRCSLGARMSDLRVAVIEPSISAGAVTVERIADSDQPRVEGESRDAAWILRPQRPIPGGQSLVLKFSYTGNGETAFLYYVGPEIAFASGWGDSWYPVIEGTSGKATGNVTVHVPKGWTAVGGYPQTSAETDQAAGDIVRFAYPHPTYFTFVAGPYTVTRRQGTVPLSAYLLTPRKHVDMWLAGVESMMDVLSSEFGAYPFGDLILVEVPRELAKSSGFNAFSPAGMVVLNSRAFDAEVPHLLEWLGHELGHQWFPHAVTWDPPGFPYLEEALAEYGGLRIVEEMAGPEAARRTRTSGFEYDPIYSAAAYFKLVGAGADRPLASMGQGIDQRNLAYNKGSLMFDMLSREVGRTTFQHVLHDLTRGSQLGTITWKEFLRTVNARSGRSLDWFFRQWLERAGVPDFQLSWTQEGDSVRITVTQPEPSYRAHLEVEILGGEGQRLIHVIEIKRARTNFTVTPRFRARSVVLDPDYEILRWTPEFHAMADTTGSAPSQNQ